jgi:hypothetical protein
VKPLRSYLEDRYERMGRTAKPLWFVVWLAFVLSMATSFRWWALSASAAVFVSYLIVVARIECPRCGKPLGLITQMQPGGRRRKGLPLIHMQCPHCRLTLDEPV